MLHYEINNTLYKIFFIIPLNYLIIQLNKILSGIKLILHCE
jgi:hypothetical protein